LIELTEWTKLTMVLFMTRLGIKGKEANFHSQVKKAIMVIPPTTNIAIKEAEQDNNSVRCLCSNGTRKTQRLTVLPMVIGATV
jgi:hypothetical protein